MKPIFIIYLLLFGLLLTSCNSQKRLSRSTKQTAQLSEQLGFNVKKKDDLRLYTEAAKWLGTPYRYGGNTLKGVDCSGLVNQIYQNVYHKKLERTTKDIVEKNCRKISKSHLTSGNLVFFSTSKKRKGINHVGLFLKNGYFIHASTSKGVIISHLDEEYYQKKWKQGGKIK
ncbi:MAG: C40 family peptidase [Odoribacter sp.]